MDGVRDGARERETGVVSGAERKLNVGGICNKYAQGKSREEIV